MNCGNTKSNEYVIIAVEPQFKQLRSSPRKKVVARINPKQQNVLKCVHNLRIEFGTAVTRRLKPSRASAVLTCGFLLYLPVPSLGVGGGGWCEIKQGLRQLQCAPLF